MYWIIIFLGVIFLSISLSNPVYKITINKFFKINFFFQLLIRVMFFIISTKIQITNPNEHNKEAVIKTEFNTNILFSEFKNILSSPKEEIKLLDTSR